MFLLISKVIHSFELEQELSIDCNVRRSRLSQIVLSGSPTMLDWLRLIDRSASTSIRWASIPSTVAEQVLQSWHPRPEGWASRSIGGLPRWLQANWVPARENLLPPEACTPRLSLRSCLNRHRNRAILLGAFWPELSQGNACTCWRSAHPWRFETTPLTVHASLWRSCAQNSSTCSPWCWSAPARHGTCPCRTEPDGFTRRGAMHRNIL